MELLVNLLAADEKYPVLNRDNLTIPIQMQLYQKQKTFSQFSAGFLKSTLYFKYFEAEDNPHRFCISEITDSKNVVKKCLKRTVLEDPSTSSMVNVPNHFLNEPLLDSLITTKSIEFKKVSVIDMKNLGTSCEQIRWRWKGSCSS